jgi:RsiW-degrading membrane proteinase PrsW (M82 family)
VQPPSLLLTAPTGLLPVAIFLLALMWFDSYKLVRLRTVLAVIGTGAIAAAVCYFANAALMQALGLEPRAYSRYVSPLLEEALKAAVIVVMMRTHRVGFLVDAAIYGFAVGAGFAWFENAYFLQAGVGTHIATWIVRGFGTAIMHGGATALFGVMAYALTGQRMRLEPHRLLPGFALAALLHSAFNHFPGTPVLTTFGTLLILPVVLALAFQRGSRRMGDWLRADFDADAELLALIASPDFSDTPIGRFLHELREKFDGPVVVDMLCYLRVYTELAIRAKGVLLAREAGLEVPPDELTQAQFEELRYLEKSIGPTGLLAMRPFLMMERADLWQLNVLQR